jgi:hypothetical protein
MPNRRYDRRHQKVRKRWAPKVRAGKVKCARCGELIKPNELWDLDHDDDDRRDIAYIGPSHRRCNRASVTHLKAQLEAPTEPTLHSREW